MKSDDELFDLAARIESFDRARHAPTMIQQRSARPAKANIAPREKAIRRWVLTLIFAWSLLVYAAIFVQRWGKASALELVFGFCFAFVCALVTYGFFLFYAELGKSIWRRLRRGGDGV